MYTMLIWAGLQTFCFRIINKPLILKKIYLNLLHFGVDSVLLFSFFFLMWATQFLIFSVYAERIFFNKKKNAFFVHYVYSQIVTHFKNREI